MLVIILTVFLDSATLSLKLELEVIAIFDLLIKFHAQPITKVLAAKSLCFINLLVVNQFHLRD